MLGYPKLANVLAEIGEKVFRVKFCRDNASVWISMEIDRQLIGVDALFIAKPLAEKATRRNIGNYFRGKTIAEIFQWTN